MIHIIRLGTLNYRDFKNLLKLPNWRLNERQWWQYLSYLDLDKELVFLNTGSTERFSIKQTFSRSTVHHWNKNKNKPGETKGIKRKKSEVW